MDSTSVASPRETLPGYPISAWTAGQVGKRKRQLRMSVEVDQEASDNGALKRKRWQDRGQSKGCSPFDELPVGRRGGHRQPNGAISSYELDRHHRLAFGPALGTRSMTRWRASNGIISQADLPNFHYRSYVQKPSKASVTPKTTETKRDCNESREKCAIERFNALYIKGDLIGRGGYGRVYAGFRKTDNLPVALKVIETKRIKMWAKMLEFDKPIPLEIALLRQVCRSPTCHGIAQLLDYIELPGAYVLVLERPEPCQDLFNYIQEGQGFLEEPLARHLLRQVLDTLLHCHNRGVVHRDLKPENLLVEMSSMQVKLLDFGSASVLREGQYTDVAGTPEYFPPETVQRGQYFALPATTWSLGILLFQMIWGDVPFYNDASIIKGTLYFPRGISRECRHLIRVCLTMNPKDRPTLEQLLAHPWMQ